MLYSLVFIFWLFVRFQSILNLFFFQLIKMIASLIINRNNWLIMSLIHLLWIVGTLTLKAFEPRFWGCLFSSVWNLLYTGYFCFPLVGWWKLRNKLIPKNIVSHTWMLLNLLDFMNAWNNFFRKWISREGGIQNVFFAIS